MSKIKCPNCKREAELKMTTFYPYQAKPYDAESIHCSHCGYIKQRGKYDV